MSDCVASLGCRLKAPFGDYVKRIKETHCPRSSGGRRGDGELLGALPNIVGLVAMVFRAWRRAGERCDVGVCEQRQLASSGGSLEDGGVVLPIEGLVLIGARCRWIISFLVAALEAIMVVASSW